jgi:hypothetical protein
MFATLDENTNARKRALVATQSPDTIAGHHVASAGLKVFRDPKKHRPQRPIGADEWRGTGPPKQLGSSMRHSEGSHADTWPPTRTQAML